MLKSPNSSEEKPNHAGELDPQGGITRLSNQFRNFSTNLRALGVVVVAAQSAYVFGQKENDHPFIDKKESTSTLKQLGIEKTDSKLSNFDFPKIDFKANLGNDPAINLLGKKSATESATTPKNREPEITNNSTSSFAPTNGYTIGPAPVSQPSPWTMFGAYFATAAAFFGLSLYIQNRNYRKHAESSGAKTKSNESTPKSVDLKLEEVPKTRLVDVGGMGEIKDQFREEIEMIRRRMKGEDVIYNRCFLLTGPTGVGKTKLARAFAGELGIPYDETNATSLSTHTFVGDGIGRIEKTVDGSLKKGAAFQVHLRKQPNATGEELGFSLVFVDEIEILVSDRDSFNGGGSSEDGKSTIKFLEITDSTNPKYANLIIIAATNKPDLIDEAIKRSGRFIEIPVNKPTHVEERKEIIESLINEFVIARGFSVQQSSKDWLANASSSMVGADLNAIFEEAIRISERAKRKEILIEDLSEAFFRTQKGGGRVKKISVPLEDQIDTMVHEIGHGLFCIIMGGTIDYISALSRGTRLGVLGFSTPISWEFHQSYQNLMSYGMLCVGGRGAEIIHKGYEGVSTGASKDYEYVRQSIQHLLEVGLLGNLHDFGSGIIEGKSLQAAHRERLNRAVRALEEEVSKVVNEAGVEWFRSFALDLIQGKKEYIGEEAHKIFLERVGQERLTKLIALYNASIQKFTHSEYGPGWREGTNNSIAAQSN